MELVSNASEQKLLDGIQFAFHHWRKKDWFLSRCFKLSSLHTSFKVEHVVMWVHIFTANRWWWHGKIIILYRSKHQPSDMSADTLLSIVKVFREISLQQVLTDGWRRKSYMNIMNTWIAQTVSHFCWQTALPKRRHLLSPPMVLCLLQHTFSQFYFYFFF